MDDHGHRHGGGRHHVPGHTPGGHAHGHPDKLRDRHGNPEDHAHYLANLLDPERAAWQKPDEVVAALGLVPGSVACDVGAGPGVFALRMARAVGPSGRVHAIDVDPRMTALLEERAREERLGNLAVHLAPEGRGVPPEPVDVILLVNAFHHLPEPVPYLRELAARLKPGGRLVNVDFREGELPVGPPPDHRVSREAFLEAAAAAGLALREELRFLPYQYCLVVAPG